MNNTDLTARGKRAATTVINAPLKALSFGTGLAIGGVRATVRRFGGSPPVPPPTPSPVTPPPAQETPPAPPARRQEPGAPGEAFATEPTAVSRDSEHGRAADDEQIDEWYAEHDADDPDLETPVGTTAADVGYNPDTAETDLQQPGTESLLDPGTAKAIRSESETMRRAADPQPD